MSEAHPMFTEADVIRLSVGTPFFEERCQALLSGIRISRQGFMFADDVDYETLGDVVQYLLDKGALGFFNTEDYWGNVREAIGIRSQTGSCGPYTKGFCPLPGQQQGARDDFE